MLTRIRSLNAKLLLLIVPAVLLFSLLETVVGGWFDYHEQQEIRRQQWHTLSQTQLSAISYHLWNFEIETMTRTLENLEALPQVLYAEVYDDQNILVAKAGQKPIGGQQLYTVSLDVPYADRFVDQTIGRLVVVFVETNLGDFLWQDMLRDIPKNLLIALTLIAIIFFANRYFVIRPLQKLGKGFMTFEKPETRHKLPVVGADEVGELIAGYNRMIEKLEQHEKRQQHYVRNLESANRSKTDFLANMSHELRTPLNAIIGFSEIIKAEMLGKIGEARYRDYAEDIHSSGRLLLEIINDILDMSKVEAGEIKLNETVVDLRDTMQACIRLVNDRAQSKGIALSTSFQETCPHLFADETRLRQILLNLISNAVKFTPEEGKVDLSVKLNRVGQVELRVRDNGIGIPPDKLDDVLKPFTQVDSHLTRQHEGTGLGLPLAKSLMALHGGEMVLQSTLGRGTIVTLCFPMERTRFPLETTSSVGR